MRHRSYSGYIVSGVLFLGMMIGFASLEAKAEIDVVKSKEFRFSISGEITARNTYENWFEATPSGDNSYDYFFTRTRLKASLRHSLVGAHVQLQDVHMWNLPETITPGPQGPLGTGAIYNLHRGNDSADSLILRQAYLEFPRLFLNGFSARVGRFDYAEGQEVMYENQKVNWLKTMRISDRLIGPFDWSSFNRSFDGVQAAYSGPGFSLNTTFAHPTQGGFENDAHRTIPEIDLATLTATVKYGGWINNTEGRLFYYYYNDSRNIANTPGQSGLEDGNIRINTFGTHWLRTEATKNGTFDMLFWGALQEGEWGAVEHNAWAVAAEAGFQFSNAGWTPWIRGGYFVSSGDSDPADGKHETFYQLLPTARKYALFPFYNLMNNEDIFLQVILKPTPAMTVRADFHSLGLHERNDLWYAGAGPTQRAGTIFGYIGRPSNNFDDLARVLEVAPAYNFSKYLAANLYYGHVFGGDVIKSIYGGDGSSDFFYVEVKAQF